MGGSESTRAFVVTGLHRSTRGKSTRNRVRSVVVLATTSLLLQLPAPHAQAADQDIEGWQNLASSWGGTLQGTNSRYSEGDTIPLRFTDKNETAGSTHTVALRYDFSSGSVRFIDSLGSYNHTVNSPPPDPCAGVAGCGSASTWSIPADPSLPPGAQNPGVLTTYNISALTFGPYSLSGGVKTLPVTFTVSPGGGSRNVVMAYGGHLARETEWGFNNGASQFSGGSGKAYASYDNGP